VIQQCGISCKAVFDSTGCTVPADSSCWCCSCSRSAAADSASEHPLRGCLDEGSCEIFRMRLKLELHPKDLVSESSLYKHGLVGKEGPVDMTALYYFKG
jgi:hypothetical protein